MTPATWRSGSQPCAAPTTWLRAPPSAMKSARTLARQWWGAIRVQLAVKSTGELRALMADLDSRYPQVGVEDQFTNAGGPDAAFVEARLKLGQQALAANDLARIMALCRQGCPTSLRADMWELALCPVETAATHADTFDQIMRSVQRTDLLVDKLALLDVKHICDFDDNYFIFYSVIRDAVIALNHDLELPNLITPGCGIIPAKATVRSSTAPEPVVVQYPPSGFIPFRGSSYYVTPLCFLSASPARVYSLLRGMYSRYFCLLHTISSHPQGLVRLCLLFETLLHTHQPLICARLVELGVDHLSIIVPWLVQAFSGFLEPLQVLLLWDRVVGCDSLEPLAVLAAAIFAFRKQRIMAATHKSEVCRVLADLRGLLSIPLLQFCLFPQAERPA
eukprot:m.38927 g.38927  ORF g.38927 m.38927 type:complete len:391 (-) comp5538_c0_seq2:120-1292(-)